MSDPLRSDDQEYREFVAKSLMRFKRHRAAGSGPGDHDRKSPNARFIDASDDSV
jgi:hypothetical protein